VGRHGVVVVRHGCIPTEAPYSPCGIFSKYDYYLLNLHTESVIFAEELAALGLAVTKEYGPSVAYRHVPLLRWDPGNHRTQSEGLRNVVRCVLLLQERLCPEGAGVGSVWIPNEIWCKIFAGWCAADFYR
jgi:hypothetical protein